MTISLGASITGSSAPSQVEKMVEMVYSDRSIGLSAPAFGAENNKK
jgi:hypothetical protein